MAPGGGSRPAATRTAGGPSTTAPTAEQAPGATWPPAATGSRTVGSGNGNDDRKLLKGRATLGEQPVDRLPGAQAGRGQGTAKVLLARGPAGHVLGVCLVMPDIGDVADVHAQQCELAGHRPPAEAIFDDGGVTPLDITGGLGAVVGAHHD